MNLVKFSHFSYRYKGNEEYALDDINLTLESGKFILLCGETGSGKTSLIRSMNGLIPQFYAGFYKGFVEVGGKNTVSTPIVDLSTDVGIVFQNPENQLISMNVEHEIAFGMENIGLPKNEISLRMEEVVNLTEIGHLLDKAPFELSGGEQQRVAIASILALEPQLLILDEPTALLDPYMAEKIISLIKKIQVEKNLSVIISEHRLDLVIPEADEIILMKKGKILEHGGKEEVINGSAFKEININQPFIYRIFNELKTRREQITKIPSSIEEALTMLQLLKRKSLYE